MDKISKPPWLFPEEQSYVVGALLELGLLKFDNGRKLPLKKGGTTDVYINLRDARNHPEAISLIADLFAFPLVKLCVDRFVEVPDSVSCFAGQLSFLTHTPYLTIREGEKSGRVSDAKLIGNPKWGEKVMILDDVITDGASKIAPYRKCQELGLLVEALVVLVDRQQGWPKHLAEQGIQLPVWPGMTLHDVRKHLIQTFKVMRRCDPVIEEKNPIIVALDGKSWEEILLIIDPLRTTGCILKVNDLLLAKGIEWLLPNLSVYGRVMADLKGHDIPNTVKNIAKRLSVCPPWAVTVHASGQEGMIKAAVDILGPLGTKVLAVTVLTSFDRDACQEVFTRSPLFQVKKLAEIAHRAGAHGFVCSPEEVGPLHKLYPDKIFVTPGVRSPGQDKGDQKRVATPAEAIAQGATHIVCGRQILGADDPVAEVYRLLKEELGITL